ncbi:hypothetical protein BDV98DRAFT_503584, partial [Pterulicium gracile]
SIGDFYRPCTHFRDSYYTGNSTDCGRENCGLSSAHKHTAPNCPCPKEPQDERKIRNLFRYPCDDCKKAEWSRRTSS